MTKKNIDPDVFLESATGVLRSVWGYSSFREPQVAAIRSVGSGSDVLAVLPTGGGKSLLYQVPALIRDGLTIVVSPLIALMEDQVRALKERGVAAAAIAGLLPYNKAEQLFVNAQYGAYKLLYLAPERLESDLFAAYAQKLNVSLLAVDEAHCVSEWSRSFRPAYRNIPQARALMGEPQTLAVTATATPEVRADVVELLKLRSPKILVQGFRRTNLALVVERCDRRLDRIVRLLKEHDEGAAIVYATTRRTTEGTAGKLRSRGISAAFYHGGLNRKARTEASERWMSGGARVMVATNAFGMGIDKSDVRWSFTPKRRGAWKPTTRKRAAPGATANRRQRIYSGNPATWRRTSGSPTPLTRRPNAPPKCSTYWAKSLRYRLARRPTIRFRSKST